MLSATLLSSIYQGHQPEALRLTCASIDNLDRFGYVSKMSEFAVSGNPVENDNQWVANADHFHLMQASLIQSGLILGSALLLWGFRTEDSGGYGAAF